MPEIFDVSGPVLLQACFDWSNHFHRRSIAASLVQGVYSLEHDRQRGTKENNPHRYAPPWWKGFHFELDHVLVDDIKLSYFGAIYKLSDAQQYNPSAPRYVIAFRGTLVTDHTIREDMKNVLKCAVNKLEVSTRFQIAYEAVEKTVLKAGDPAKVWLAGHSLGASLAMLVGRKMAMRRVHLETYLFNLPCISVRIPKTLVKAGIATVKNNFHEVRYKDLFDVLSEWTPYLYVNQSDPICSDYIGYFMHKEEKEEMGAGRFERIATKHSFGRVVFGTVRRCLEPLHIVPTAFLTVNDSPQENPFQAHGIVQWWQPHIKCDSKLYKFKTL